MREARRAAWRIAALVAFATGAAAVASGRASAEPGTQEPLVKGFRAEAYECGRLLGVVEAARGIPGTKRLGFLRTALIPTIELEEVRVERRREDGTLEELRVPRAIMEWGSKALSTPSGQPLFKIERPARGRLGDDEGAMQSVCQG